MPAIVAENETARIEGLQASLAVLAGIALLAQFFTRRIPTRQPADATGSRADTMGTNPRPRRRERMTSTSGRKYIG